MDNHDAPLVRGIISGQTPYIASNDGERRRTSYYESTIHCANPDCTATLIVCGENLLSQTSRHAACVEACGWRWRTSDDTYGLICPTCSEEGR